MQDAVKVRQEYGAAVYGYAMRRVLRLIDGAVSDVGPASDLAAALAVALQDGGAVVQPASGRLYYRTSTACGDMELVARAGPVPCPGPPAVRPVRVVPPPAPAVPDVSVSSASFRAPDLARAAKWLAAVDSGCARIDGWTLLQRRAGVLTAYAVTGDATLEAPIGPCPGPDGATVLSIGSVRKLSVGLTRCATGDVSVEYGETYVIFRAGPTSYDLFQAAPASDFPAIPEGKVVGSRVLPRAAFGDAFKSACVLRGHDDARLNISGVRMEAVAGADTCTVTATNGHALIRIPFAVYSGAPLAVTIRGGACDSLTAFLRDGEDSVTLEAVQPESGDACIRVRNGDASLMVALESETFPEVDRVIPATTLGPRAVERKALIKALSKPGRGGVVTISATGDQLAVTMTEPDVSSRALTVPCDDGEAWSARFTVKSLAAALRALCGDVVTVAGSVFGPATLRDGDTVCVVMPDRK